MSEYEYLPQLIVAYDSDNQFASLIHISEAKDGQEYKCPCCGGIVKPRTRNSTKEQSHYYHLSSDCSKESQMHFYCKNYLLKEGTKVDEYEIESIEIEKTWETPFGDYRPDVTVKCKDDSILFIEMFFSVRKRSSDYFCKWQYLNHPVYEVNVKEYFETGGGFKPKLLFKDGKCYNKEYTKRDLYSQTIAKIKSRKDLLEHKIQIGSLDEFWQLTIKYQIASPSERILLKEDILKLLKTMDYESCMTCYEIIKKKQCMELFKNDVITILNDKVIDIAREKFDIPDLEIQKESGYTYMLGKRFCFEDKHVHLNVVIGNRVVLRKKIYSLEEILKHERFDFRTGDRLLRTAKKYEERLKCSKYDVSVTLHEDSENIKVLAKIDGDKLEPINVSWISDDFDSQVESEINYIIKRRELKNNLSELLELANEELNNGIVTPNISLDEEKMKYYGYLRIGNNRVFEKYFTDIKDFVVSSRKEISAIMEHIVDLDSYVKLINSCQNNAWKAVNNKGTLELTFKPSSVTMKNFIIMENLEAGCLETMRRCLYETECKGMRVFWE